MPLFNDSGSIAIQGRKPLIIALYWGALWGLAEATLGHLLHMVRIPGLAGFVMVPVGIFFMLKSYRDSTSRGAIFYTAVVAAAIKLSDLWLPGTYALDVLRPAIAIIAESVAFIVLLAIVENKVLKRYLVPQ